MISFRYCSHTHDDIIIDAADMPLIDYDAAAMLIYAID